MGLKRLLPNVCSSDLPASKAFYMSLFGFEAEFDSDWFVQLKQNGSDLELGIIAESHEIVPGAARGSAAGFYLTFVVDDVDKVFERATASAYTVLQRPEPTFYGQKRLLLRAPEGTICDVSSVMQD